MMIMIMMRWWRCSKRVLLGNALAWSRGGLCKHSADKLIYSIRFTNRCEAFIVMTLHTTVVANNRGKIDKMY